MTRTIETTLYTFDELSEKAQAKAIDCWRNIREYCFDCEVDSLKKFFEQFNIDLKGYSIGCGEVSIEWMVTNAKFRGVRLSQFTGKEMPTGYYTDNVLYYTFYDEFKQTGDALYAFNKAVRSWCDAVEADIQERDSDSYIREWLSENEYEFRASGSVNNEL
jgi:hypothetical protein